MRVAFHSVYPTAAADLWNRVFPSKYAVDAELIRLNTVESGLYDPGASVAELDDDGKLVGYIVVKRSASELYTGPDPDQAHLAAVVCEDPTVAIDLFAHAKRLLINRGLYKIVFGQDILHFWPGCPSECSSLRSFLTIAGFVESGEVVDLERDLTHYEPPVGCLEALGDRAEVRPLSDADIPKLEEFFNRSFPGRWKTDTLSKIQKEHRADFVYGLFVDGALEGFAVTQDWTHNQPLGGAVWRKDLGEQWGGLGPIGISESVRGKGLGNALLGAALLGMKQRGIKRAIIDWTGLIEFYGNHGFEVTRRYTPFTLRLEE